MPQCILGLLTRQLAVYRQRVTEAPVLRQGETLSRGHVTQVVHEAHVGGRRL
jgi:hypothetical protein